MRSTSDGQGGVDPSFTDVETQWVVHSLSLLQNLLQQGEFCQVLRLGYDVYADVRADLVLKLLNQVWTLREVIENPRQED